MYMYVYMYNIINTIRQTLKTEHEQDSQLLNTSHLKRSKANTNNQININSKAKHPTNTDHTPQPSTPIKHAGSELLLDDCLGRNID